MQLWCSRVQTRRRCRRRWLPRVWLLRKRLVRYSCLLLAGLLIVDFWMRQTVRALKMHPGVRAFRWIRRGGDLVCATSADVRVRPWPSRPDQPSCLPETQHGQRWPASRFPGLTGSCNPPSAAGADEKASLSVPIRSVWPCSRRTPRRRCK